MLEDHVNQPEFLKQLEDAKEVPQEPAARPQGEEVLHEEWWEPPKGAVSQDTESDDGYLEVCMLPAAETALGFRMYQVHSNTIEWNGGI